MYTHEKELLKKLCQKTTPARSLADTKQGTMPPSDAWAFQRQGIPSVCFSSGPSNTSFQRGIGEICATLHNNINDNRLELINFSMIPKIQSKILETAALMDAA